MIYDSIKSQKAEEEEEGKGAEKQEKAEEEKEKGAEKQKKAEEEKEEKSEEEVVLRRFDQGFEKWLRNKSEAELERVVSVGMRGHAFEADAKAYLECVQSMEHMVKNCSKCRRKGCEKCTYVAALRYVARRQKPAEWWQRTGQSAVLGAVRFLKST